MRRTLFLCTLAVLTSASLAAQTAPPPPAPQRRQAAPRARRRKARRDHHSSDRRARRAARRCAGHGNGARRARGCDGGRWLAALGEHAPRHLPAAICARRIDHARARADAAGGRVADRRCLAAAPHRRAPKPPEPVAPAAADAHPSLGPPGDPKVTPVPLFLEKNFIGGREGRKDSPLGCTATGTATLHQLREAWLAHTARRRRGMDLRRRRRRHAAHRDRRIRDVQAGTFSLVPHTVSHALVPQGRNPLIVISVLSGPPCKAVGTSLARQRVWKYVLLALTVAICCTRRSTPRRKRSLQERRQ